MKKPDYSQELKLHSEWLDDFYITITEKIGYGHSCLVWAGVDQKSKTPVAVKIFKKDHDIQCANREIAILHLLKGVPGVVQLHNVLRNKKYTALVFELIDGTSLETQIESLEEKDIVPLFRQIVLAVFRCRQLGVVHRDLSPSNIMITAKKEIKIIDFGLAEFLSNDVTGSHMMTDACGTPRYMAQENFEANFDAPFDIKAAEMWTLGMLFFDMAQRKKQRGEYFWLWKEAEQGKLPISHLSTEVQEVLRKLLRSNPVERMSIESLVEHKMFGTNKDSCPKVVELKWKSLRGQIDFAVVFDISILMNDRCAFVLSMLQDNSDKRCGNSIQQVRQLYLRLMSTK